MRWIGAIALVLTVVGDSAGATSSIAVPETVSIPAGAFVRGSDRAERELAYVLDEIAYGASTTRNGRWYEGELDKHVETTGAFEITRTPITVTQYAAFVTATGHPAPDVDPDTWRSYGFIHPYERTRRFAWSHGSPPADRGDHPVVLVSHADVTAYAEWLSRETGRNWRLPHESEWEKAARGSDGRNFPWGDRWDAGKLNSHDSGPFDTMPVGHFPLGASPFGMLDAAGQVFEWTADRTSEGRYIVKGGSWDDKGCGVCRPAARHARTAEIKHILVGFRLVVE